MGALERIVNFELQRFPGYGSVSDASEAGRCPGRLRFLLRNRLLREVLRNLPAEVTGRNGFVYFIYAQSAAKRRQLLDIGMASSPDNLRRRLRAKQALWTNRRVGGVRIRGSGSTVLRVSVAHLQGVGSPADPVDLKALHCHELVRQYLARRTLGVVGNYDPRSWSFDDFEDVLGEE